MGKSHIDTFRSEKDQSEGKQEPKRSNSKTSVPSGSIWSQSLEQAMFSPRTQKKNQQKGKQKLKEKNKNRNSQRSESKPDKKQLLERKKKNSDASVQSKKKNKDRDIEIEEKKIDLSVKPGKPGTFSQSKDHYESGRGYHQPKMHKHKSEHKNAFYRNKKFDREEFKKFGIPDETVSSFYQWDEHPPAKFSKNRSQNYSHGYSQNMTG